jgi:sugar phosphate isomerase/epimerase
MRLGIFAKTFPGDGPLAVLDAARAAGFEAVQYNMACSGLGALPQAIPDEAVSALREASDRTGVAVAALSATYNMIHPDPGVREAGRAAFAAIATLAQAIGTLVVTACSGSRDPVDQWRHHPDNSGPAAWADFVGEMRLILDLADRHGVAVGVEPEPGNVVSTPAKAMEVLDLFAHPRLGIVLDPANLFESSTEFREGRAIEEAVDLLAGRIVLAHAKDRDAAGRIVPAGQGIVDFPRFLARLRRAGFDGAVVTHGLSDEEAPEAARRLRAALEEA